MLEKTTNRRHVLRNAGLVVAGAAIGTVAPAAPSFAGASSPADGSDRRRTITGAWKLHRVDPDAEYDGIWLFAAGGVSTYQDIDPPALRPLLGSWSESQRSFRYELWVGFEADPATSSPATTAQVVGTGVRSGASFSTTYHVVFFDASSGATVYTYDGSGTGVPCEPSSLLRSAQDPATPASPARSMCGTRRDGAQHLMRGLIIFGVRDGLAASARFFLEPVDPSDDDATTAVRHIIATPSAVAGTPTR